MSRNPDHDLPADLLELERQLRRLVPVSMSAQFHARLEGSVRPDHDHAATTVECFEKLEVHLREMAPATMPGDMIDRMVRAMDNWHEQVPVEEKLVAFADGKQGKTRSRPYGAGMFAAVAAVALLGAIAALVLPGSFKDVTSSLSQSATAPKAPQNTQSAVLQGPSIPPNSKANAHAAGFVQDSLTHKVTNSSDQGVVFAGDDVPHRCIRVEYVERIIVQGADGRRMVLSRPGVKYLLYPVETY